MIKARGVMRMVLDRGRPPFAVRVAIAAALACAAVAVRIGLQPVLAELVPWVTFFPAILVATVVGGAPTGVMTLLACAVAGQLLFVPAGWDPLRLSIAEIGSLAAFLVNGGFLVVAGHALRRAVQALRRRTAEAIAATNAVRESERTAREIADSAPAILSVADEHGNCVFLSRAWGEFTGQTPEEGLGLGWMAMIHPDDAAMVSGTFMSAFERRTPAEIDFRMRRADGDERWVMATVRPWCAPDGAFRGFVGSVVDITDRKRAELALAARDAELRSALRQIQEVTDHMAAAVTRCGRDRRYLWASRQYGKWLGLPLERIVGRPIAEVIGDETARRLEPRFARVLAGERVAYEEELEFPVIGRRWVSGVYVPTRDERGTVDGWVAAIDDVTDRKGVEEALRESEVRLQEQIERAEGARRDAEHALAAVREANRRKDEFLAMLAHELRNPLAPIRNAVAAMRTLRLDDAQLDRVRDIVDRQVTHMTRLVDDLLDVSRITRGKIKLERAPIALSDVIEEAIESARPLIEQHEHTLSLALEPTPIALEGDRARLVQVVANLLSNAAKFTPRGGHIVVETARADRRALIKVRDTGIGIPRERQDEIFELFAQEESTLARSQGGLGIGLTLVRQLVALHGGTVAVESEGRGRGSEFTIALPALVASELAASASAADASSPSASGALRVLVVEDNPDAAESFAMLLDLEGHDVRVAHHGVQALRLLDDFTPHVAFLDIGLPEMTGYELAKRMRADPRLRGVVLVALTGYGGEEDKQQARAAGFDHHLTKPVEHGVVTALLAAYGCASGPARDTRVVH